jgi:hypothetical protein
LRFVGPQRLTGAAAPRDEKRPFELPEIVAMLGFVVLPIFCFLLARLMGVPLYGRYSISTVIGFACLAGMATVKRPQLAAGLVIFLVAQIGIDLYQYAKSDVIREPSISLPLSTREGEFAQIYQMMRALPDKDSPIALLGGSHEFMPILQYAPPDLASRLVYLIGPGADNNGEGCVNLRRLCDFPGKCERMTDFLAAHDRFVARGNSYASEKLGRLIRLGADIKMESIYEDSFLVSVTMKKPL